MLKFKKKVGGGGVDRTLSTQKKNNKTSINSCKNQFKVVPMNKNFKIYNNKGRCLFDDIQMQKSYLTESMIDNIVNNKKIGKQNSAHNIAESMIAREKSASNLKGDIMRNKNIIYNFNCRQTTSKTVFNKLNKFVLFCVFVFCFVMCIQPLFFVVSKSSYAEGLSSNTFYKNSPIFIAGGANNNNNVIDMQSVQSLFNKDGINKTVLQSLLNMIDSNDVWNDETGNRVVANENGVTYLSAKNFGYYKNNETTDELQKGNSRILVKLFENSNDVDNTNKINDFTNQFFQVVYRSISEESDVLTFYMCKSYTTAQFNPMDETIIKDYTYKREGNYSVSLLRTQTVLPVYETLTEIFGGANLDNYVVAPYQLSSQNASDLSQTSDLPTDSSYYLNLGAWQSSLVQTSANANGNLVGENVANSLGTSSYGDSALNPTAYSLGNGLDGLNVSSIPSGVWASTMVSAYKDKLWVPSSFETVHTGYSYEAVSNIVNVNKSFDNNLLISSLVNAESAEATLNDNIGNTRTGLWELNAYDRAEDGVTWSWVRSGRSTKFNGAKDIEPNGANNGNSVEHTDGGVRLALHIDLNKLKQDCNLATLTTSDNQSNGMVSNFVMSNQNNKTYNLSSNSNEDYVYLINNFNIGESGGLNSITNLETGVQTSITFNNNISSRVENGIADIEIISRTANQEVYKISNVNMGEYKFNVSYSVLPSYNCSFEITNNCIDDVLLVVSSDAQVFVCKLTADTTNVNITMPKLTVGRLYTITVVNGEISGQLVQTGDVTVNINPYTFICNSEDATVTLSGITINSK